MKHVAIHFEGADEYEAALSIDDIDDMIWQAANKYDFEVSISRSSDPVNVNKYRECGYFSFDEYMTPCEMSPCKVTRVDVKPMIVVRIEYKFPPFASSKDFMIYADRAGLEVMRIVYEATQALHDDAYDYMRLDVAFCNERGVVE